MNTSQIIILSVIIAVSASTNLWSGPQADNKIGHLVEETPEVAEARRQHIEAYLQIRNLLPELPQEERDEMINFHTYQPQNVQLHQHLHHQIPIPQQPVTPSILNMETQPRWTGPFADHVLGQRVKETPEVAAARKSHEIVYSKIRSILPELQEENDFSAVDQRPQVPEVYNVNHPSQNRQAFEVEEARKAHLRTVQETAAFLENLASAYSTAKPVQTSRQVHQAHHPVINWNDFPADTPEVAAAKLEHAKAIAAILNN